MEIELEDRVEKHFKPFPKQAEFFAIPTSIKEGFFGGAAGPGKSTAILMDPIMKQFHLHPRFHGIIFRQTFRQLEESLIMESQHLYSMVGGRYSGKPEYCWTFPSGAKIRFSYLERDEQVYDHDTAQYHYAGFDELTAFTRFQYMYIVHSRVRTTVQGLPAYSRSASNPLGIGHAWVKERFITPCKEGRKVIREIMPDGEIVKRIFIPGRATDNPKIMEEDPQYLTSLSLLPEAEKRSKLYGDWDAVSGQVFTELRTQQMPDEPNNALHVIPAFMIPTHWPVILSIDWGFDAMTWAGFLAIAPNEQVYLCQEFARKKTKIKLWAADLALLSKQYANLKTPVTLDGSAFGNRGEEKTLAEQIEEGLGLQVERADKDRVGGKLLLHEYLRFTPAPAKYIPAGGFSKAIEERIYRLKGQDAAAQYKAYFEPEKPEVNLPKLKIFDTCPLAINALLSCTSNPKKLEDVLEFAGDDPYDGLRYGIKRVHRYFEESREKDNVLVKKDKILEKYAQSGDVTALYRDMEKFEDEQRSSMAGVRRYNSFGGRRFISRRRA
jgi:Terminase large subunit, T4likevirus-type, N-terminal